MKRENLDVHVCACVLTCVFEAVNEDVMREPRGC